MPLLRVLVIVLAFAQATGLSEILEVACGDECAEQDCDDGGCAPICPSCNCAPRAPLASATTTSLEGIIDLRIDMMAFASSDGAPPIPDPREILHVPILATI